jgi:polysaccharide biosynthesis transport protein
MRNLMPITAAPATPNSASPFAPRRGTKPRGWHRPIFNVFSSIRHHSLSALCVLLVLLALGAYFILKNAKAVYKAHSVIYISPRFPKILASDSAGEVPYDSYVQGQMQTVTRSDVIAAAIAKIPYSARNRTGPALPTEIQELQKTLEVNRISSSDQMSIALGGPSPAGLADIVNTITDAYIEKARNEEFYGIDERLNALNPEKDRLQKQIDQSMAEQAGLMKQLGTVPSAERPAVSPSDSSLDNLREQLANARIRREAAEAKLSSSIQKGSSGIAAQGSAADDASGADSRTFGMRAALNNRRANLMEEMSSLRPGHPTYQKDKQELALINSMLNEENKKAGSIREQDKLRQDVERARNLEQQLTQELDLNTQTGTSATTPNFQRVTELGPEISSLQKAYDGISDRIRDLELEKSSPGSIHVSTKALEPLSPENSGVMTYWTALILLSLAGAAAAAVFIDLLDSRIYSPLDVERVVGFHPLGVLLNDDEFHRDITGEYYFRLATGIDHAVRHTGARTFLFTSPAHGCGTSTVVRKLSDKLRSLDLRTRIIVSAPSKDSDSASADNSPRSESPLKDKTKNDEIPTASVASITGPHPHKRPDALGPKPMARVARNAGDQYDVVLIDAGPLPISANTEYLARAADATVIVVKSSSTTRQELDRAARLLERLEVAGVAVVLNSVSQGRADNALKKELAKYEQALLHRRSVTKNS